MLGSIHFADDSFYPLRAEIEQAFKTSEVLAVEVNINTPEAISNYQAIIKCHGLYSGDETLKDNLSRETYAELGLYLKKIGLSLRQLEKMKPGLVVLTLAATQMRLLGLDPDKGIDLHFLRQAKAGKKIRELEIMAEQLQLFFDIEEADLLVKDSLHSLTSAQQEMTNLISAWKRGDEKLMQQYLFDDMLNKNKAMAALYERLYYQRNRKMTKSIKLYLKQKGQYFVVVGAGHLIGDKSIVQLLQTAGYTVTRL